MNAAATAPWEAEIQEVPSELPWRYNEQAVCCCSASLLQSASKYPFPRSSAVSIQVRSTGKQLDDGSCMDNDVDEHGGID